MPLVHLQREINKLNKLVLQLGGQVEENLRTGIRAVRERDSRQGTRLREEDNRIDELEVQLEEEILKLLALYQPVASDLRYVVALLKINGDLERIGDLAANMGRRSQLVARHDTAPFPPQIETMSDLVRDMLRKSLDALIQRDLDACRNIIRRDREVDTLNSEIYDWYKERARRSPDDVGILLNTLLTSKDLERVADHTCNIAEDIIYLVSGEIVRHHGKELYED